jgi:hypothetical protein
VTLWTLQDSFLAQQRRAAQGAHSKDLKVTDYSGGLHGINENECRARFHVCLLSFLHVSFFGVVELAADLCTRLSSLGRSSVKDRREERRRE